MTVTSPSSGPPARIRRRGAAAFVALVVALLLSPFAAVAPAVAATPTPDPTPTHSPSGIVSVTLSPGGDGVVQPGSPLTATVEVVNDTVLPQSAGRFVLEAGAMPFASRAALQVWLDGELGDVRTVPVGSAAVDAIEPLGDTTGGIVVPASDPALSRRAPGVYPLLARYERGGSVTVSTSALIVPDPAAAPTPLTVVVPITAGPVTTGLLTADQLTTLTAPDGDLTAQLDAVTGTDAVLAVDPAILAAIRVLGASAPPDATAWLDRLLGFPNERFALQFGDADPVAQLDAGLSPLLEPRSLQAYMRAEDFPPPTPEEAPDGTPTPETGSVPSPTPTGGADAPVYPDLSSLLDIGSARPSVFWPIGGTADADAVGALARTASGDDDAVSLIPSTSTAAGSEARTVPASATVGDAKAHVLVYDAAASEALRVASGTDGWTARGRALAAVAATLAMAAQDADGSALLVAVERGAGLAPGALSAALRATEVGAFRSTSLAELIREDALPQSIATAAADPERASAARLMSDDETRLTSFATILADPTLLTGPERAEMLQLLGAGWAGRHDDWRQAVADHRAATRTTLDSVGLLPPPRINLFAAGAGLGFWVRNDLPYPVDVVLSAIPDDLRVDVQRETTVHALPQSNTRVDVPVQSRVGSGEVGIELQLRSRTNVLIGGPQLADVNVRAEWEGIGVAILGALVAALIVFGLWRTIRRRRRAAAEAGETPEETPGETPEETPEEDAAPPQEQEPAP